MLTAEDRILNTRLDLTYKPKQVLCYGHDMILLQSRRRILELAGCPSELASTASEFQSKMVRDCPSVIVFCQTILREEGVFASALAQEHCPAVPLLLLYNHRQSFTPVQEHHYFQSLQGPRAFAATVFHLLYDSTRANSGQSDTPSTHG